MRLLWTALAGAALWAEVVDRTAVLVDRDVITASAIEEQIRISALLDAKPVDLSPANRRRMAARMVEQMLIRREMRVNRFAMPPPDEASRWIARLRGERPNFDKDLQAYGLNMPALHRNLLLQLGSLRFIDLRFRPGTAVGEGEIELYYREEFVPDWQRRNPSRPAPELDDARDQIEAALVQRKVDQNMDAWIEETRTQTRVEYFPEAFQ